MTRCVIDVDRDAAEVDLVAVSVQLHNLFRLTKERTRNQLRYPRAQAVDGVGQHEPVGGMHIGGAAEGV
ncbi:Uncharacterised protein [Mycobacterium tuberculosis]|nr:Uncharacterised protein [Mycobacterium tuberculosis]